MSCICPTYRNVKFYKRSANTGEIIKVLMPKSHDSEEYRSVINKTVTYNVPKKLFRIPIKDRTSIAATLVIIGARAFTGESSSFFINKMFKRINNTIIETKIPDESSISEINGRKVFFCIADTKINVFVQGSYDEIVYWSGKAKLLEVKF